MLPDILDRCELAEKASKEQGASTRELMQKMVRDSSHIRDVLFEKEKRRLIDESAAKAMESKPAAKRSRHASTRGGAAFRAAKAEFEKTVSAIAAVQSDTDTETDDAAPDTSAV